MLDRLNVSISVATMLAVFAKIAVLFEADKKVWLEGDFTQSSQYCIAMAFFLVFFRGKMMHDDSAFFADIEAGKYKDNIRAKRLAKIGLILGYLSWILWAPTIYFLEFPKVVASFMLISLVLSTAWIIVAIFSEIGEDKKAGWWIIINIIYGVCFFSILNGVNELLIAGFLIMILFIDWVASDPIAYHLSQKSK